ncbi:hypothetical protein [Rubinisphaera italica]|uniref:Uncharacterized protein n=1 Tax=Rubinisphaera italica TaxID=2527969 RepID=A0A5C5XM21_9PLAN|nr:hypothetical protein [Rubinisphaera italica]TWT63165.1 hypothetical protein Pan54_39180 [Rubinisphaera italica]
MKVQIESTEETVNIDGVECRVWNGVTEKGVEILVFVHRVGLPLFADDSELFELEEKTLPKSVVEVKS